MGPAMPAITAITQPLRGHLTHLPFSLAQAAGAMGDLYPVPEIRTEIRN